MGIEEALARAETPSRALQFFISDAQGRREENGESHLGTGVESEPKNDPNGVHLQRRQSGYMTDI